MAINILLICVLIICLMTDIKSRKIYNKVIFPTLVVTLVYHVVTGGWSALADSLIGFSVGFAILLIPYLLGGMGAGDVKLLALIGAIKGTIFVLNTALFMALFGGLIALFLIISDKAFWLSVKQKFNYMLKTFVLRRYGIKLPAVDKTSVLKKTYPYGIPIAAGAFITLILGGGII